MDAFEQLAGRLSEWTQRLLVKGLAKLDAQDIEELRPCLDDAIQLDMEFLAQLLQQLTDAGNRYVRDSRADIQELVHGYFYLCEYVKLTVREGDQP